MNKKLLSLVAVMLFVVSGSVFACGNGWFETPCSPTTSASESNAQQLSNLWLNQAKLVKAVPSPVMETSLERKNISKRAELLNNENKISYIYLVSFGKVMAFYTVSGKVSSLNSYMVPQDQLVNYKGEKCNYYSEGCYVMQAPDIDGSYGENTNGIFFFTTEGIYVEWNGEYMLSDQPLTLTTTPELIRNIK